VHSVNDKGTHFQLAHLIIQFKTQYKMEDSTVQQIFTVQLSLLCKCRTLIRLQYRRLCPVRRYFWHHTHTTLWQMIATECVWCWHQQETYALEVAGY